MWSGPRNISTALMRSFENRLDTFVSDEPFYAHYLKETGEEHPYRRETIQQGETSWDAVVEYITGDIPNGKKVWYQKHMAQHNMPGKDMEWIDQLHNILLIRDPREVISSYIKKYEITSINQLGYSQQTGIYKMLIERGLTHIIIDARNVLENPAGMIKELCGRLSIPFYKEMLSWQDGRRDSDGIWGKYWYGNVERSRGFQPAAENNDVLPTKYECIIEECMEHYQQLYQHRIRIV